jgi:YD repeat-containing protein
MPGSHEIGVDREGNAAYADAEILKKITYPTGGYSMFNYEPNSVPVTEEKWQDKQLNLSIYLTANQNPFVNSASTTFRLTKPSYVYFSINTVISSILLNDQPGAKAWVEINNGQGTSFSYNLNGSGWINLPDTGIYTLSIKTNTLSDAYLTAAYNLSSSVYINYPMSLGIQSFNKLVGGLRIKNITDNSIKDLTVQKDKYFVYEQPLVISPIDAVNDYLTVQDKTVVWPNGNQPGNCNAKVTTRNASTRFSYGSIQGGTVGYGKVTTLYGLNSENGKTVSIFSSEGDASGNLVSVFPYTPSDSRDHRRGLLLDEKIFTAGNNLLQETSNTYDFINRGKITVFKSGFRELGAPKPCAVQLQSFCNIFTLYYDISTEQVRQLTSAQKTYNGTNFITTTTTNYYDNPNNTHPTRTEATDSRGNIIKSISRTPLEKADINAATPLTPTASAAIDTMLARNIISPVLQQEQYKANILQSRSLINYKNWTSTILQPENIQVQKTTNPLETRVRFNAYDNLSNLLEQQKDNDVKQVYIYGYGKNYPVAQVIGADYTTIAALVNQTVLDNPLSTDAQIRAELNNLRIGLANTKALVSTYTYKPLVGVTSETDANGKTKYYEYDAFNRLVLIRDQDNNILKKICYNYAGQPENCLNCTNFTPNWQNTTTVLRCQQGSCGNTGYQEQEQKDINPCSATYNQTQWVLAGYNPTACPTAKCISLTSTNIFAGLGYTASYYNTVTGITYNLTVSSAKGLQRLGSIPVGTYTLTISKTGFQNSGTFYSGCGFKSQSGTSATFFGVPVSLNGCISIKIDMSGGI